MITKEVIEGEIGLEKVYINDVTVPRALLVLCLELLESASKYTGFDDDYDLAMAQLRAHTK